MSQTIFHPKNASMTKDEVFDLIENHRDNEEFEGLAKIDESKLSDALMQTFVDQWYDAMYDNIEFGDDAVGSATMNVLLDLAKKLV